MSLLLQLLTGALMIGTTVMIHAAMLDLIIRHARKGENFLKTLVGALWRPVLSSCIVVSIFMAHIINIWLWATLYILLECPPLESFSDALYFATVTYTTLGYGDIILSEPFRMLSGIEAANGFILFGWTTAFIFEIVSQLYRNEGKSL